jgi:hypothetical protein
MAGHSGFLKTYQRIKKDFLGERMKKDIENFVIECQVCQRNKGETVKAPSLLQPLHIPHQRWEEISMDFITSKDVFFVVVGKLTKYAYFCGIQSTYMASQVA